MIRVTKQTAFTPEKNYVEMFGLSTDTKPTALIVTGSVFVEVDTGDAYLFDEASSTWIKQ